MSGMEGIELDWKAITTAGLQPDPLRAVAAEVLAQARPQIERAVREECAAFIESQGGCHCEPEYTERGLHAADCCRMLYMELAEDLRTASPARIRGEEGGE